jgi:predicted  nucleic acid-binding Zn-ribbon protein
MMTFGDFALNESSKLILSVGVMVPPSEQTKRGVSPAGISTSPESVVTRSQELYDKIKSFIESETVESVDDGDRINFIYAEDIDKFVRELEAVVLDGKPHSVPLAHVQMLQSEVATLKLHMAQSAKTDADIAAAKAILQKDLREAHDKMKEVRENCDAVVASLNEDKATLVNQLSALRTQSADLKAQLAEAKRNADMESVAIIRDAKQSNSAEINRLNNLLQSKNGDISQERQRVSRLEQQILALTVELNTTKAKQSIMEAKSGDSSKSFAAIAARGANATYNLVNDAYRFLRHKSLLDLSKVQTADPDDVKSQVFWLKAAVDHSRHAVYGPYRKVLGGLLDDIKLLNHSSRIAFKPFVDMVHYSLSPQGKPLSEAELVDALSSIRYENLVLHKGIRKPGMKTFAEFLEQGAPSSHKGPLTEVDPEPVEVVFDADLELPESHEKTTLTPSDSGDEDEVSYYVKVRTWFNERRETMRSRLASKLAKSKSRLHRYYKLATGGLFKRLLSIPYSWWVVISPF